MRSRSRRCRMLRGWSSLSVGPSRAAAARRRPAAAGSDLWRFVARGPARRGARVAQFACLVARRRDPTARATGPGWPTGWAPGPGSAALPEPHRALPARWDGLARRRPMVASRCRAGWHAVGLRPHHEPGRVAAAVAPGGRQHLDAGARGPLRRRRLPAVFAAAATRSPLSPAVRASARSAAIAADAFRPLDRLAHGIPWDAWVMNADGSNLHRAAVTGADEPSVSWSPDSSATVRLQRHRLVHRRRSRRSRRLPAIRPGLRPNSLAAHAVRPRWRSVKIAARGRRQGQLG